MKNKERVMAMLDEIRELYSDVLTENLIDRLQIWAKIAYESAERCDLRDVLFAVVTYTRLGEDYWFMRRSLIEEDVLVKIARKISDAEDLLIDDVTKILQTKCGCRGPSLHIF
jgi:hypothetical protein